MRIIAIILIVISVVNYKLLVNVFINLTKLYIYIIYVYVYT